MPSIQALVEHRMVVGAADAKELRLALLSSNWHHANLILETAGLKETFTTCKSRNRVIHHRVTYFDAGDPDAETLISIDYKAWFIGQLSLTIHHLTIKG